MVSNFDHVNLDLTIVHIIDTSWEIIQMWYTFCSPNEDLTSLMIETVKDKHKVEGAQAGDNKMSLTGQMDKKATQGQWRIIYGRFPPNTCWIAKPAFAS